MIENYLRVCGEYIANVINWVRDRELPPRVRRILGGRRPLLIGERTTSACAENT